MPITYENVANPKKFGQPNTWIDRVSVSPWHPMNHVPDRFRIATLVMALILGWFAFATIFAQALTPKTPYFFAKYFSTRSFSKDAVSMASAPQPPRSPGTLADWAAEAAPLRGDLLADLAMAGAAAAANSGSGPATPEMLAARARAIDHARQSLSFAPHASDVWLLLALLESRGEGGDSVAELLKMSYLTARADVDLIPARLFVVATSAAVGDAELRSLASGDIRLILNRRPDLKGALTSAYRQGSADGKAFFDEAVRSIDAGFAESLRGTR